MKFNASRKSSSGSVGLFVVFAVLFGLLGVATVAWTDQEVGPKAGETWGDPNEGNKMLQMAQDPAVVRGDRPMTAEERDHHVPKKISTKCTDSLGHPLDPATPAGQGCSVGAANALTQPAPRATAGALAPASGNQGVTISQ
jgi:hypothetical protein